MIKMAETKDTENKEDEHKEYSEKQLVVFTLGNEEFGVDINEVNSIIKMVPITKIPNSQDFIEGVINLRGRIIVVVDLAKKLGLESKERDKDTRIIVVETKQNMVGMIVDHSREAIRISEEQIEPAPPLITQKISSDYLEGVAIVSSASEKKEQGQQNNSQENDRLLILLDLAKILNEEEMESVEKTQSSGQKAANQQDAGNQQKQEESQDNSQNEQQGEKEEGKQEDSEQAKEGESQEEKKEGQ